MPVRPTADAPLAGPEFSRLMAPFAVPGGARVAVAVSGGADSLCLAVLAADWAKARGAEVIGLTVDHGLRPEAADEAAQAGVWLGERGIRHHILTWDAGARITSAVQRRARAARYRLMTEWCRDHGVAWLLCAHHLDDQAETVLMRLKRSTTLFGLAAMAPTRDLGGVALVRPLLTVPKARLQATLNARSQTWIEDPSNTDVAYERVRVRALLGHLAEEGVTAQRLAGAAHAARRMADIIDAAAAVFERDAVRARSDGALAVDARAFAHLPVVVQERALSRFLQRLGRQRYPAQPAKVTRLNAWLAATPETSPRARSLGGCVVRRSIQGFIIAPEPPRRAGLAAEMGLQEDEFFASAPLPRSAKNLTSWGPGTQTDVTAS